MIIQIYEIQSPEEAEKCIQLGVDHIGSVIPYQYEWRLPSLREAISLSTGAGAKTSLIPLFQHRETIYKALDYYRPNYVHLCNSLTGDDGRLIDLGPLLSFQSDLKEKFPEIDIIRTIPIPRPGVPHSFSSLKIARSFEPVSSLLLIDTWEPKGPGYGFIGITGKTPDWKMARELVLQNSIPVILAGGLSPRDVFDAIMEVLPAGVDSCTNTNEMDKAGMPKRFKKDFYKVEEFVREVRRAEREIEHKKVQLGERLYELEAALREREATLPPHSIKPHQIMAIEELEEEISQTERELRDLK